MIVLTHGPDALRSALLLQTMAFPVLAALRPRHESRGHRARHGTTRFPCRRRITQHVSRCAFLFNPFAGLEAVQQQYLRYVHTFQTFRNPQISAWVGERVNQGTLLWRDPTVQLGRFYRQGLTFDALEGLGLHPATRFCSQ